MFPGNGCASKTRQQKLSQVRLAAWEDDVGMSDEAHGIESKSREPVSCTCRMLLHLNIPEPR